jgi:hypothetical protein
MPFPAHKPTDESRREVSALASFGVPQVDIAAYIGVSKPTLAKHYAKELKLSSIKANGNVAKFLYSMASGAAIKKGASYSDCGRQAMFWAKTRMGWRETTHIDNTSSDGSMTPSQPLTDAELRRELEKRGLPPTLFDE